MGYLILVRSTTIEYDDWLLAEIRPATSPVYGCDDVNQGDDWNPEEVITKCNVLSGCRSEVWG